MCKTDAVLSMQGFVADILKFLDAISNFLFLNVKLGNRLLSTVKCEIL